MIAWFGPRGLSSLLLVLLPVFAGLPGSEELFAIACLVVLMSVVVHGGSPMLLGRGARRRVPTSDTPVSNNQTSEALGSSNSVPDLTPAGRVNDHPADGASLPAGPVPVGTRATSVVSPAAIAATAAADDDMLATLKAPSLTIVALRHLWETQDTVIILDVRTDRTYDPSPLQARGAVRLPPDHVAVRASELALPREAWLVAYCA
jgi:sodium/hydrogen antiporter